MKTSKNFIFNLIFFSTFNSVRTDLNEAGANSTLSVAKISRFDSGEWKIVSSLNHSIDCSFFFYQKVIILAQLDQHIHLLPQFMFLMVSNRFPIKIFPFRCSIFPHIPICPKLYQAQFVSAKFFPFFS